MSRSSGPVGAFLLLGVVIGGVASLGAKPQAKPGGDTSAKAPDPGICEYADWACVSECISEKCADECLRKRCQRVLDALVECSSRRGCEDAGTGDTRCVERTCTSLCRAAFGPPSQRKPDPKFDPCSTAKERVANVPKELIGTWNLSSASLEPLEERGPEETEEERLPRPDYARSLRITETGCFVLVTPLEDATLGEGNRVTVRSWGTVEATGTRKKRVRFLTTGANADGTACKVDVEQDLRKSKFLQPTYEWQVEREVLSLTGKDPEKTSYQFERKVD
jgi:hypothetical protein